ncbi:MAG TPA: hypothetical protein VNB90_02180 [Cytophagaceae bacterium]|jgi:hypothetical protein|nr:hypothetical protein [Cytophagaceae bacterium]
MRNIKHHCIILTTHELKQAQEIRAKMAELIKNNIEASNGARMIGEISESLINNFYSLVLYPDGSKEGHETSDDGDILRKKIIEYLIEYNQTHTSSPINFVELYYGADNGKAEIIHHG